MTHDDAIRSVLVARINHLERQLAAATSLDRDVDRLAVAGATTIQLSAHLTPGARPRWQATVTVWDQHESVSTWADDGYDLGDLIGSAATAIGDDQ